MGMFNWDSSLSVNIIEIDNQHKKLVSLVDELFEAMKKGQGQQVISKTIAELVQYTKNHFATEEKIMKANGYPDFLTHKKEHDDLVSQVTELNEKAKSGQMVVSTSVMNFLKGWLVNHIKGTDMKYKPFLNNKGVK